MIEKLAPMEDDTSTEILDDIRGWYPLCERKAEMHNHELIEAKRSWESCQWSRFLGYLAAVFSGHLPGKYSIPKLVNSLQLTILFIMELEEDEGLSFLDALLTRREDSGINIRVYRMKIHTDRYLQYSSHRHAHAKNGVASCMLF